MSPVIRQVTEEEVAAVAKEHGWTVVFTTTEYGDRVALAVKNYINVTFTKKGERVEEVIDTKGEGTEDFRHLMVAEFGGRAGFRYTTTNAMYDGEGNKLEYIAPTISRPPLSDEHKRKLLEGRAAARAAKAAEASEQLPKTTNTTKPALPSEEEQRYSQGFYREVCRGCLKPIKRTGRKGRAPTRHEECKE